MNYIKYSSLRSTDTICGTVMVAPYFIKFSMKEEFNSYFYTVKKTDEF